jgi:hypothetical protein
MNHGSFCVQLHIITIWQACYYAWQSRYGDRHEVDEGNRLRIALEQLQRRVRVLYHLRPYDRIQEYMEGFHATPEEHFQKESSLAQFEQWIATCEP